MSKQAKARRLTGAEAMAKVRTLRTSARTSLRSPSMQAWIRSTWRAVRRVGW